MLKLKLPTPNPTLSWLFCNATNSYSISPNQHYNNYQHPLAHVRIGVKLQ